MPTNHSSMKVALFLVAISFAAAGCHSKSSKSMAVENVASSSASPNEEAKSELPTSEDVSQDLPLPDERWTGDFDGMLKRRRIRALVAYSRSAFFYDDGQPEGTAYEALQAFQRGLNDELNTGNRPLTVTFLPVGYGQLESALTSGLGDLIAVPVAITPEREARASFSSPIATHVREIVVTGPTGPILNNLDDLSGKKVFANPVTVYYQQLQELNKTLEKEGKKPVILRAADKNLTDEDLLEMVNAGLIPATVTQSIRAEFWAKVYPHLRLCSGCVLTTDAQLAWVMRKGEPELKQRVDAFVRTHRVGTTFGNTLLRRYLQNTDWVKNATSDAEMEKFDRYVDFFKKYAAQYDFDYLMLVALSYQESQLNQNRRSPMGAVGIMQVMPRFAAASPIEVPNVNTAEPNIHAGTKMLREISDTYFKDQNLDELNRTLFVFASYNAGPTRIAELRKKAAVTGLNPNQWFGNVELVVAQNVGQQTVRYVSNIYKYYVSYKLAIEESNLQKKAEQPP